MTTTSELPQTAKTPVSLWELATREADCFRWLESERSGYDVGPVAQREWSRRYWRIFCRYRRIEHLTGQRRIREFDEDSFGRLSDPELLSRPVFRFVIEHFTVEGWENLQFLFSADLHGFELRELHEALSVVDVNSVRFDPPRW